MTQTTGTSII